MCEQACPVRRDRVDVAVRPDRTEPRRDDVRQGEAAERLRSDGDDRHRSGANEGGQVERLFGAGEVSVE